MTEMTKAELRRCTEAVSDATRSLGVRWITEEPQGPDGRPVFGDHNKRAALYAVWYDGYTVGRYYKHAPLPVRADAPTSDNLIRDRLTGTRGRAVVLDIRRPR